MHRVSSAIRYDAAENLFPDQCQIANQIKHFVSYKFIVVAQRRIHQPLRCKHDRVFCRSAPDQSLLAHGIRFVQKSEGPRRSNLSQVVSIREIYSECLAPNQPVGEVDGVRN